jgi:hypothetical protein
LHASTSYSIIGYSLWIPTSSEHNSLSLLRLLKEVLINLSSMSQSMKLRDLNCGISNTLLMSHLFSEVFNGFTTVILEQLVADAIFIPWLILLSFSLSILLLNTI